MNRSESYFNRESSWLNFNQRVLEQAFNPANPILERVKFLAITASNLDEFFMVRVGSLSIAAASGSNQTDIAGLTAQDQLKLIRKRILEQNQLQYGCLLDELLPGLAEHRIQRLEPGQLSSRQREYLASYFEEEIVSVLSPIAVERPEDFPVLRGARMCVCVRLGNGSGGKLRPRNVSDEPGSEGKEAGSRFVLIPFAGNLPRIITLPRDAGYEFLLLEDLIGLFLDRLLPEQKVLEWTPLRIIRNADFELDEEAGDFLREMQQLITSRATSDCVRLELSENASEEMRKFLQSSLVVEDDDIYLARGPLDLSALMTLVGLPQFPHLREAAWPPVPAPEFAAGENIFDVVAQRDVLLLHPYQNYDPVLELIQTAARDPGVLAIKQTLYRTSRDSKIVSALADAAESGKHVTVVLELKARFDEQRNINWAKRLERAGVDVIYGVSGLKTHAKLCVVVRREKGGIKRYVHFGTGNYNEVTANLYSDVSFLTSDAQLAMDAVHVFNAITGLSVPQTLEKLSLAPINLRASLLDLIEIETANAEAGIPAEIVGKLNSLVDQRMIDALYKASQAGVKVRLNIRGICCLRPGVKGLSENIRVTSVVDRFLEHSRILQFRHGGDQKLFIGSADWMTRNLDRRIELLIPIEDPACRQRLSDALEAYFKDNVSASELRSDGTYRRVPIRKKGEFRSQAYLYEQAQTLFENVTNPRTTVFRAHRSND
jgi:polyphosphate kinase